MKRRTKPTPLPPVTPRSPVWRWLGMAGCGVMVLMGCLSLWLAVEALWTGEIASCLKAGGCRDVIRAATPGLFWWVWGTQLLAAAALIGGGWGLAWMAWVTRSRPRSA